MANRQIIIDTARKYLGSHYLWGSGGNTPGQKDGVWYRTDSVTIAPPSLDPKNPSIFTAECSKGGPHVCAGRYNKIPGGRKTKAGMLDLQLYLGDLSKQSPELWEPYYKYFTPRFVKGSTISAADGGIAWGEDCRNRKHFDCISFINYVLSESTKKHWWGDIASLQLDSSGTIKVTDGAPVLPGDIVFKNNSHIAFLCENGKVIQAEMAINGVHEHETYVASNWTERRRVPDSLLS